MVYYLGKDVKVYITTETDDAGVKVTGTPSEVEVEASSDATTLFAHYLNAAGCATADYEIADLTGIDIGIGAADEDISYIGGVNVLKAEIKKETTISLTRKKSDSEWDVIFGGDVDSSHLWDSTVTDVGARWGISYDGTSAYKISNGLFAPEDHVDSSASTVKTFGYRIHVRLKASGQVVSIPGCTITGHTVSINGDGTSEETLEFMSYIDIISGATLGDVSRLNADDL
jgi:hypothetical protein